MITEKIEQKIRENQEFLPILFSKCTFIDKNTNSKVRSKVCNIDFYNTKMYFILPHHKHISKIITPILLDNEQIF
ncbi:MAG: hypothetical protein EAZ06_09475 [Cytophagales bacterium]|nr:MAG: hypothetical protein EAZ06_09475 [Cytophagales bacterium]